MNLDDIINGAVANKDWFTLVLAVLLIGVPAGLQLAGKKVPIVDALVELGKKMLGAKAKAAVVPPPAEGEKTGLAAVIDIKPEDPKP